MGQILVHEIKIMNEKEVAQYFQISERTLYNYRKEGHFTIGLEYFYVGKQIRYNLQSVLNFFLNDSKK